MDLSRLGSGVYRVKIEGEEDRLISGKLYHVLQIARDISDDFTLEYLSINGSAIDWKEVCVEKHQHYHGEQAVLLLQWFYHLDCGLSTSGFKRFERITGVSAGRIQDALRRADTISHKPLSAQAMLYITYKINDHLAKTQLAGAVDSEPSK